MKKQRPPKGPDLGNREQVKRLKRAMDRSAQLVVRCKTCGHQQASEASFIGPRTTCDKCGAALHACVHCKFFDTRVRSGCRKGLKVEVGKLDANECSTFEARAVLDATGKRLGGKTASNAKSTFDGLFKK